MHIYHYLSLCVYMHHEGGRGLLEGGRDDQEGLKRGRKVMRGGI